MDKKVQILRWIQVDPLLATASWIVFFPVIIAHMIQQFFMVFRENEARKNWNFSEELVQKKHIWNM